MGLSYPHIWGSPYATIWDPPNPYTQKCGRWSTISSDVRLPYRKVWCLLYRVHFISSYLVTLSPNLLYTIVTQLKVYDLIRSFLIYWLSNSLTLSVPDVCHFRNVSYTLNHICTFLLEFMNFFSNLLISFYNLLIIL